MANKILLAVAGIFLLLGLGSLIVGIVLPITLHNGLVDRGREASRINHDDDPEVWANIPGERGYNLTHEYEFFEILNPNDYKYGIRPQARSSGKVIVTERRTTTNEGINKTTVTTYDKKEEIAFGFTQTVDLEITGGTEFLTKEIMTPNPEVFAQLAAIRDASPWHVAIRALKQIVDFTVNEYYRRAIVAHLFKDVPYYLTKATFMLSRGKILTDNGVSAEVAEILFDDKSFGFSEQSNMRFWADS